ncbi:MAG: ABC transporter permease [Candidatus Acidiferrales bacterium]
METLWQDIRFGARMLAKNRGFTIVAVLTLAFGIGANSAIFSVVNAVLLRPLPFRDPDRLVIVWETSAVRDVQKGGSAAGDFLDWREQSGIFDKLTVWRKWTYTVQGNEGPEQLYGVKTSVDFFRVFGVKPMIGRDFLEDEEIPGHEHVVILSYALWQRQFGGDQSLLGRPITIDEQPYTVVGILPPGFSPLGLSRENDVWMPVAFDRAQRNYTDHTFIVLGRLKPGIPIARADAAMKTLFENMKKQGSGADPQDSVRVVSMHDDLTVGLGPQLRILLGAVGCVLLIGCANVANLLLARAATREKEIALRTALGARRFRLIRQLLTESVMLAIVGGALGLLIAYGGLHIIRAILPEAGTPGEVPHANWIGMDGPVLGFTLLVSIGTGIIFGLVPAMQVSQSALGETLKEMGRGTTGGRGGRAVRAGLVVAEVAISLVLLVGAGLLIRSFVKMMSEDLGIHAEGVQTMQVWLPESRYPDTTRVVNFYRDVISRISTIPGVQAASAANFVPLSGWRDFVDIDIEGRAVPKAGEEFTSQYVVCDSNFFNTMGMRVKEGRELAPSDGPDAPGVAVINDALAHQYWPNEDPVGRQIKVHFDATKTPWRPEPREAWLTIVGIVGNIREWELGDKRPGEIYVPYLQNPSRLMRLIVRSNDPAAMTSAMRSAVLSVDKSQAVGEVRTVEDFLDAAMSQRRLGMVLLGVFAGLATFLAAVGIYGVMSYAVSQRLHEIGIRMALGAQPGDVLRLVVREGLRLTLIGSLIGGAASIVAARWIASDLYGVKAWDPATLAGVVGLLISVALLACYIPARRATRVDPMRALRYE